MTLTAAQVGRLTNEELLRLAQDEQDPVTSSPLDLEITKRLGAVVDELQEHEEMHGVLDEFDSINASDLRGLLERAPDGDLANATQLLSVLLEEEQTTAKELRERLQLAEKLHALFQAPSDVVCALETITNTAIT